MNISGFFTALVGRKETQQITGLARVRALCVNAQDARDVHVSTEYLLEAVRALCDVLEEKI